MLSYCAYSDCTNKYVPFSSTTFFTLPRDQRRPIWIEFSGNPSLKGIKPTTVKSFCEKHFDPKYLMRQFNRTLLRKDAIPYNYLQTITNKQSVENVNYIVETEDLDPDVADLSEKLIKQAETEATLSQSQDESNDENRIIYHITEDEFENCDLLQPNVSREGLQEYADIAELLEDNGEITADELIVENIEEGEHHLTDEMHPPSKESQDEVEETINEEPILKKARRNESQQNGESSDSQNYDEDRHFALSLLGYFRRLPPKTKAIAKLKILQYLTELEFDKKSSVL